MKKYILGFGVFAVAAVPVITAVSCGGSNEGNSQQVTDALNAEQTRVNNLHPSITVPNTKSVSAINSPLTEEIARQFGIGGLWQKQQAGEFSYTIVSDGFALEDSMATITIIVSRNGQYSSVVPQPIEVQLVPGNEVTQALGPNGVQNTNPGTQGGTQGGAGTPDGTPTGTGTQTGQATGGTNVQTTGADALLVAAQNELNAEQTRVNLFTVSVTEQDLPQLNNVDISTVDSKWGLGSLSLNTTKYSYTVSTNRALTFVDGSETLNSNASQTDNLTLTIRVTDKAYTTLSATPSASPITVSITNATSPNDVIALQQSDLNAEQARMNALNIRINEKALPVLTDASVETMTTQEKSNYGLSSVTFDTTKFSYSVSTNVALAVVDGSETQNSDADNSDDMTLTIAVTSKANSALVAQQAPSPVNLTIINLKSTAELQADLDAEQARINGIIPTMNECVVGQLSETSLDDMTESQKQIFGLDNPSYAFDVDSFTYLISTNNAITFEEGIKTVNNNVAVLAINTTKDDVYMTIKVVSKFDDTLDPSVAAAHQMINLINADSPAEATARIAVTAEQERINQLVLSVTEGDLAKLDEELLDQLHDDKKELLGLNGAGITFDNTNFIYKITTTTDLEFIRGDQTQNTNIPTNDDFGVIVEVFSREHDTVGSSTPAEPLELTITNVVSPAELEAIAQDALDAEQERVNAFDIVIDEQVLAAVSGVDFTTLTDDQKAALGLDELTFDTTQFTYTITTNRDLDFIDGTRTVNTDDVDTNDITMTIRVSIKSHPTIHPTPSAAAIDVEVTNVMSEKDNLFAHYQDILDTEQERIDGLTFTMDEQALAGHSGIGTDWPIEVNSDSLTTYSGEYNELAKWGITPDKFDFTKFQYEITMTESRFVSGDETPNSNSDTSDDVVITIKVMFNENYTDNNGLPAINPGPDAQEIRALSSIATIRPTITNQEEPEVVLTLQEYLDMLVAPVGPQAATPAQVTGVGLFSGDGQTVDARLAGLLGVDISGIPTDDITIKITNVGTPNGNIYPITFQLSHYIPDPDPDAFLPMMEEKLTKVLNIELTPAP